VVNVKPCVVKGLPADIREAVDNQLTRGIPAPSICRWLDNQGFKVTPRQIYGYKDKTIPKAILSEPKAPIYSPDASDSQMLRSLLKTTLDAVSSLQDQYETTGDLKTAKMLKEMTDTAAGLLKYRLAHEQPETAVSVSINIGNLEDSLEPDQGSLPLGASTSS
jgi:hypothetical protein